MAITGYEVKGSYNFYSNLYACKTNLSYRTFTYYKCMNGMCTSILCNETGRQLIAHSRGITARVIERMLRKLIDCLALFFVEYYKMR